MKELLSQAEYARRKGFAPPYLSELIRKGKVPTVGKNIDPKAADKALIDNAVGARKLGKQKIPYSEALRRKMLAAARLSEMELAQKKGELVELESVRKVQEEVNSNIRSRLLLLPPKLAQRLVGIEEPATLQAIVEAEVVETLNELAQAEW